MQSRRSGTTAQLRFGHGYPGRAGLAQHPVLRRQKEDRAPQLRPTNPTTSKSTWQSAVMRPCTRCSSMASRTASLSRSGRRSCRPRRRQLPHGYEVEALAKMQADAKYIVCNADEGDPGAYMNRNEIEGDPHALIEGMAIAGVRDARDARHHLRSRRVSACGAPP